MLGGAGMAESQSSTVKLINCSARVFKCVLRSFYAGRFTMSDEGGEDSVQFLFEVIEFCEYFLVEQLTHEVVG